VEARDRSSLPLAEVHVGITPALAAIAESGTVIVGPGDAVEGLLAVLPPHHIVVVSAAVVEADLPAALARVAGDAAQAGSRLVFISGPSRTADIELTTVLGVHGPLRLDVVIVREWGEV
jgi:L-lactate dehydrogenase complex protein LldG